MGSAAGVVGSDAGASAAGAGTAVLGVFAFAEEFVALRCLTKVTSFQRSDSGKDCQEGMPLLTSPLVMYQKTSPSGADCAFPAASEGMLPEPSPLGPWQAAQRD